MDPTTMDWMVRIDAGIGLSELYSNGDIFPMGITA